MLAEQIERKSKDFEKVSSEYAELRGEQGQCSKRLRGCEQRRTELYAKQGRGQQFRSKEERDSWIKKVRRRGGVDSSRMAISACVPVCECAGLHTFMCASVWVYGSMCVLAYTYVRV